MNIINRYFIYLTIFYLSNSQLRDCHGLDLPSKNTNRIRNKCMIKFVMILFCLVLKSPSIYTPKYQSSNTYNNGYGAGYGGAGYPGPYQGGYQPQPGMWFYFMFFMFN